MRSKNYVKRHNINYEKVIKYNKKLQKDCKSLKKLKGKKVLLERKEGKVIGITREFVVIQFNNYKECFNLVDIVNKAVDIRVVA